jgi:hypothetical protein
MAASRAWLRRGGEGSPGVPRQGPNADCHAEEQMKISGRETRDDPASSLMQSTSMKFNSCSAASSYISTSSGAAPSSSQCRCIAQRSPWLRYAGRVTHRYSAANARMLAPSSCCQAVRGRRRQQRPLDCRLSIRGCSCRSQYWHGRTASYGRGGAHAGRFNERVRRSMRGRCGVSDATNASGASPRGSDTVRRAQHGFLQAVLTSGMYSEPTRGIMASLAVP